MKTIARSWLWHAVFVWAGLSVGCGSTTDTEVSDPETPFLGTRLQGLDKDLSVGSSGEQVALVHEYLRQYGYLPNAKLAIEFPTWRPAVSAEPASEQRFDEHSRAAVEAFQSFFGLDVTGTVDVATRRALQAPRCEHPDQAPTAVDPAEKFALNAAKWDKTQLTWRLENTDDNISLADARAAIANALAVWANTTNLSFTNVPAGSTSDLIFRFSPFPGGCGTECASAETGPAITGTTIYSATIKFWSDNLWSVSSSTPFGRLDLMSTAIHEAGHALGLTHSSVTTPSEPCMAPGRIVGTQRRSLTADDQVAMSLMYDAWTDIAGAAARDIATGPDGSVWIVSNILTGSEGFAIQTLVGSTFQTVPSIAGVRIDVDASGRPWVVTATGKIKIRSASGAWNTRAGCAKDLALKGDMWWIVSCESDGASDFNIKAWNGTGWTATDGFGVTVAVSPNGVPWAITSSSRVWRKHNSDPASPGWALLPNIWAVDIAVDPVTGYAWYLDANAGGGADYTVGVWNEQAALSNGGESAPNRAQGTVTRSSPTGNGMGVRIAVFNSDPWIVKSDWGTRRVLHVTR